jgi:hypothetical protein
VARADGSQARYWRIDQLNHWIEQFGAEQKLAVVDYHAVLVAADGRPIYLADG